MNDHGLTPQALTNLHIGPIIFREECVFKKEIKFGDEVKVSLRVDKATVDFSKFTIVHAIWKNSDTLSALITVDGAWIDTFKRKLTVPPDSFKEIFRLISKDGVV